MSDIENAETQAVTTLDLVNGCIDRDASQATNALSSLLGPKLMDAIQAKKVEVAQSIYGTSDVGNEEDNEVDSSDPEDMENEVDDTEIELEDEAEEENENA